MKLSDVSALITGGTSGIGYETARLLKEAGANVAVCGRNEEALKNTADQLGVLAVRADIANPADVNNLVNSTLKEFGTINLLINNAAYGYFSPLTDIDLHKFEKMMAVNLTGTMLVSKEVTSHMLEKQYGTIINISSTAGLKGFAGGTPYVASKFALKGMTQCWAYELRKHNIRVVLVNPSEVQTNFASNAGYQQTLSERKLKSEDIAHAIIASVTMEDRGFIPELTVWATNPD
jgi:3-oxoacyl-[acyl-carrier protein] reductase